MKRYLWMIALAGGITGIVFLVANLTPRASALERNGNSTLMLNTESVVAEGEVLTLNDQSFDKTIKSGIVLVDFWATWCRPCVMQAPIIDEVNTEMQGKITVGKLDVDSNPLTSTKYAIRSIPTLIIFKDGEPVAQFIGLTSKESLSGEINNILSSK